MWETDANTVDRQIDQLAVAQLTDKAPEQEGQ